MWRHRCAREVIRCKAKRRWLILTVAKAAKLAKRDHDAAQTKSNKNCTKREWLQTLKLVMCCWFRTSLTSTSNSSKGSSRYPYAHNIVLQGPDQQYVVHLRKILIVFLHFTVYQRYFTGNAERYHMDWCKKGVGAARVSSSWNNYKEAGRRFVWENLAVLAVVLTAISSWFWSIDWPDCLRIGYFEVLLRNEIDCEDLIWRWSSRSKLNDTLTSCWIRWLCIRPTCHHWASEKIYESCSLADIQNGN